MLDWVLRLVHPQVGFSVRLGPPPSASQVGFNVRLGPPPSASTSTL